MEGVVGLERQGNSPCLVDRDLFWTYVEVSSPVDAGALPRISVTCAVHLRSILSRRRSPRGCSSASARPSATLRSWALRPSLPRRSRSAYCACRSHSLLHFPHPTASPAGSPAARCRRRRPLPAAPQRPAAVWRRYRHCAGLQLSRVPRANEALLHLGSVSLVRDLADAHAQALAVGPEGDVVGL